MLNVIMKDLTPWFVTPWFCRELMAPPEPVKKRRIGFVNDDK